MKTFLLFARARALLVFLSVLCVVARGSPSYGSDAPKMAFEFGMSPVRRGLCDTGFLYCPSTDNCCEPGSSCCNALFCCAAGYACPLYGDCYAADVITITFTTTETFTSSAVSTIDSTSTSWVTLTSTGYTTVTTEVQNGVSTSTAWVTVTTAQVMKRGAPAAPAPAMTKTRDAQVVAPEPSMEPSLVEGQTPIADLLRRALGNVGLLKRFDTVTSYETLIFTTTYFSYSYYTVFDVVTSTSNTVVQSTVTSTIVSGASATTTVTSTVTTTVTLSSGHVPTLAPTPTSPIPPLLASSSQIPGPPYPNSSTNNSGLSQGATIGIGVGVSLAAVFIISLIGFWLWWQRRSTAGSGASNRDTLVSQPVLLAGAGAAGAAGAAAGIGSEKVPISPISSTAGPSPPPTHQEYWAPQQTYEMPQQTYPPPQQTYPQPQQTYPPPQQTYSPHQQGYELPQQTYLSPQQRSGLPQG